MSKINFHTTPEFDAQLGVLMRLKAIPRSHSYGGGGTGQSRAD